MIYGGGVTGDECLEVMEERDVSFWEGDFEGKMNGVVDVDAGLGDG